MNPGVLAEILTSAVPVASSLLDKYSDFLARVPGSQGLPLPEVKMLGAPSPAPGGVEPLSVPTPAARTGGGTTVGGVSEGGGGAPDAESVGSDDPDTSGKIDLANLEVPKDVLDIVAPVLSEFNIRIESKKGKSALNEARMHFAVNGTFRTYLVHIRKEVLENAQFAQQVIALGFMFEKGDNVRVLSKDCYEMQPTYDMAWDTWSEKVGAATKYIEWRKIVSLKKMKDSDKPDYLKVAFDLPATVQRRVAAAPLAFPESPRFAEIVKLLATIGNTSGSKSVDAFFNNLKDDVVPPEMRNERSEWGAGYEPAAGEFLRWLAVKGNRSDGYSYVAAVLVKRLETSGVDERKLIVATIEQFQMISRPNEVKALKQKYVE